MIRGLRVVFPLTVWNTALFDFLSFKFVVVLIQGAVRCDKECMRALLGWQLCGHQQLPVGGTTCGQLGSKVTHVLTKLFIIILPQ